MGAVLATVALAAAVLAAAAGGVTIVAAVAVGLGLAAAVDATRLLARHGARPVLPAAALPIVALPVVAAGDAAGTWAQVGGWYAATFLAASALLLASGRRQDATLGLGATMAVAAVVGLGAGGLVLLAALPGDAGWLVVLVLLAAAADLGDRLARLVASRGGHTAAVAARPGALAALGATALTAAAIAIAVAQTASPAVLAAVAAIVLVAGRAVVTVGRSAPPAPATPARGPAVGGLLAACGTMLLAAPVAYLVVRVGG